MKKLSSYIRQSDPETLLFDYAGGGLGDAWAVFAEAWISCCGNARRDVEDFESLGGVLLCTDCQPVFMADDSLGKTLGRLTSNPRAGVELPVWQTWLRGAMANCPSQCRDDVRFILDFPDGQIELSHTAAGQRVRKSRAMDCMLVLSGKLQTRHAIHGPGDIIRRTEAMVAHENTYSLAYIKRGEHMRTYLRRLLGL